MIITASAGLEKGDKIVYYKGNKKHKLIIKLAWIFLIIFILKNKTNKKQLDFSCKNPHIGIVDAALELSSYHNLTSLIV